MVLKNLNIKKLILIVSICIGTCISFMYIYQKFDFKIQEKNKIISYLNNNNYDSVNNIKVNTINYDEEYNFIIEIPNIELKKGVYKYSSVNNNVDKNIMILKQSDLPDDDYGNIILASHSGNSYSSHFKNLDNIKINDEIIIYYEGYKYIYKVNNVFKQNKNGTLNIVRNKNANTLTLITCDKSNKKKQIIYISYLTNKIKF